MPFTSGATSGSPHVANLISTISAFLTANGWTLFDTVSATDLVFFSDGSGREAIYVRLTQSVNRVLVRAYALWNAGTNTGYNQAGDNTGFGVDGDNSNPFAFWLWTDGRAILIATKVGSTYRGTMAGALDRVNDASVGITTGDVAAGASVVVALDRSFPTNLDWQPGKKLLVVDQDDALAAAGAVPTESATVVSVAVGSVTLTLAAAHKGGALVGADPLPVFSGGLNTIPSAPRFVTDTTGWQTAAGRLYASFVPFGSIPNVGKSDRTGRHVEVPVYIYNDSDAGQHELRGKLPGVFVFPDAGAGIVAEATTDLSPGATYVALPIGPSAGMLLVPQF